MSVILFCLILFVVIVRENYLTGYSGSELLSEASLLSAGSGNEERVISSLSDGSRIVLYKSENPIHPAVEQIFGSSLDIDLDNVGLTEEEKAEIQKVFGNDCSPEIIGYLITVSVNLISSIKENNCEIKLLENKYNSCKHHSALLRRVKNCKSIEARYNSLKRKGRQELRLLKIYDKKTTECVSAISKGLIMMGKFSDSSQDGERQCTVQELFEFSCRETNLKIYSYIASAVLEKFSKAYANCKETRRCMRISKQCRCTLHTMDQLETAVNVINVQLIGAHASKVACIKYILSSNGGVDHSGITHFPNELPGLGFIENLNP